MLIPLPLFRYRWLLVTLAVALANAGVARGQPSPTGVSESGATPASPQATLQNEMTLDQLLEAYHGIRHQLRATQSALISQRAEADERAQAQSRALNEKLELLRVSLAAVNKRQQDDASRAEYELFLQQEELHRSSRLALWIASSIGLAVLLGSLVSAHFQRRAMNRIADAVTLRPALFQEPPPGWLALDLNTRADQAVKTTNQRLATALERIEQRIQELEHTGSSIPLSERRPVPGDRASRRV